MRIKNDLLLRTLDGVNGERPPIWLMRQAGRILPQYRKLRNSVSGFKELVTTPLLAAEATLQPVDELGVDAAILFSDILVVPEAMGLEYKMEESKGPYFPKTIDSADTVSRLDYGNMAAERLDYVYESVKITKLALDGRVPLIGFSGAPWTLMAYMIEGGGSKTFSKARKFLYTQPEIAHILLNSITETIISYLKLKVSAGVNVVQVFDSWAGVLSRELYVEFSMPYLKRICESIGDVPKIIFAKDSWFVLKELGQLDCQAIGLDWTIDPQLGRKWVGDNKVLQGNLDPCCLYGDKQVIGSKTAKMLQEFGGKHIANLGHGVYPDTPLDNVKYFIETVKQYRYNAERV